jgi:hypothetical protein
MKEFCKFELRPAFTLALTHPFIHIRFTVIGLIEPNSSGNCKQSHIIYSFFPTLINGNTVNLVLRSVQDVQRVMRESAAAKINLDSRFVLGKLAWVHASASTSGSLDAAFDILAELPLDTEHVVKSHI